MNIKAGVDWASEDDLKSLAYRPSILNRNVNEEGKDDITQESGGKTIPDMINHILDGVDADKSRGRRKDSRETKPGTG